MIRIGWGTRSIVPDRPAMIQGQKGVRIGEKAMDPLTVTAMAIAGQRPDGSPDWAIIASLDLAFVSDAMQQGVRSRVAKVFPDVPGDKIFLTATHSHTSLVFEDGFYPRSTDPNVMTSAECMELLVDRSAGAVIDALKSLKAAKIARGFGHAVVAHNRRPVYADGGAKMYGKANNPDFRWIEGPEDHTVDMLFVWDESDRLAGILLDVPCPSQVDEALKVWSADYWHETRLELRKRLGANLWVLPLCGAAGDQSPHFIFDSKQEAEMRQRRGVSERQEIAERLAWTVERTLACTKPIDGDVPVVHDVHRITVTGRGVTKKERDWHEAEYRATITSGMDQQLWWPQRLKEIVEMHDSNRPPDRVPVELHALRIADMALVTNPFELYTDYGLRIKARSVAAQTFLAQITAGWGWYLPTQRGADGGSYGAIPAVSIVGAEGGQELVEHSVIAIAKLFA